MGRVKSATNTMVQQLDIFNDSGDVMLRNDVLQALLRRDAAAASALRRALATSYPDDGLLAVFATLIDALQSTATSRFASHAELVLAVHAVDHQFMPAAVAAFLPADATAWLAPLWTALAQRAAALPFDAGQPGAHAAALWLQAGCAAEAAAATATIPSWRRIPQPLAWMTEARLCSDGLDATWPLLAELAWLAPARLDRFFTGPPDPLLQRLYKAFAAQFEGDGSSADMAWFPAWVLTEKPALVPWLAAAEPGQQSEAEQGFRLLLALITLEKQGRHNELIVKRQRLQGLHGGLYSAYMKSR